jgi:TRAP-type mannitol/chloroaromatic compound transport system permease small subunit
LSRFAALLQAGVIRVCETFAWLVLAVVLTLFGQLPVRELVHRGHLLINDYGQLVHATVFLVGIPYAISLDRHVRLDAFRMRFAPRIRALVEVFGYLVFVLPWVGLLAYYGAEPVSRSISTGETFPDTGNPGYPLMRVAFVLFLILTAAAMLSRVLVALRVLKAGAEGE